MCAVSAEFSDFKLLQITYTRHLYVSTKCLLYLQITGFKDYTTYYFFFSFLTIIKHNQFSIFIKMGKL